MTAETAALLCSLFSTAAAVVGWVRERRLRGYRDCQFESALALLQRTHRREAEANTRANRAEARSETARLLRVEITDPHRFADPEKEMVRVLGFNGEPVTLAFTDASFQQALIHGGRLDTLLAHGQARIIK